MRKKYEKPVLNSSMTGTLEGVYAAYGTSCGQRSTFGSSNSDGGNGDNGGSHYREDHWLRKGCCILDPLHWLHSHIW